MRSSTVPQKASAYVALFLRLTLGVTFLSAVSDRFGMWGPAGSPNVAWGDLGRFAAYAATLNPWAPASVVPAIVWFVTVAETCLGIVLIVGLFTRRAAFASGVLLFLFSLGMTVGTGVKSALNASVFSASAAAFALATFRDSRWSVDALREKSRAGKMAVSTQESLMSRTEHANKRVILEIFSALERRDLQRLLELCHADVEFHWPLVLPYGGTSRGLKTDPPSWGHTWTPLQPTDAERKMDPGVVAASDDEVVVLWRQRGVSPGGDRLDSPVLALYEISDGKLGRAQMFYFDPTAVIKFLATAKSRAA
jgi:thiosulfate dehydrogenase (quinone) large subunit